SVIRLMEEKQIVLGTGSHETIVLADREAVNILPYRFVVPFVRIKSVSTMDSGGVSFSFRHAALLSYPEESNRFSDISGVTGLSALLTAGAYTGSIISDPGALMSWKIAQTAAAPSTVSDFLADIYLVCRAS
ncbi:MAG: hypothetical protein QW668_05255, partial [Nitrososphaerota archaeon]